MYTGANAAGSLERFALFVPAFSPHVTLQASTGDFFFRTANPASVTQERMHIMQGNGNQIGVVQPNATKVNISYGAGYNPISSPVAMLNLGLDAPVGPNGGQRTWMDVGTFMCASSDNMYVGMKNEDPAGQFIPGTADRMDAVVNWGDNLANPQPYGPDNFRFIFTEVQNPATATGAASTNGLETMRITPINATCAYTGIGGDPAVNPYSGGNAIPQTTLEVNALAPGGPLPVPNTTNGYTAVGLNGGTGRSGLRFTDLTSNSAPSVNPSTNVLTVNADGDVILVPGGGGGIGTCAAGPTTFAPGTNGAINLTNNNNFYFEGNGAGTGVNNVVIGKTCTPPVAKLDVLQASTAVGSTAVAITNTDAFGIGVNLNVTGAGPAFSSNNALMSFVMGGTFNNNGIVSTAFGGQNTAGGDFKGNAGSVQNIGVSGSANSTTAGTLFDIGGKFTVNNVSNIAGLTEYGIYASATTASPNYWAGWFQGNLNVNGTYYMNSSVFASDRNLKTNIDSITNALNIIEQLKPKTFDFDQTVHPQMRLSDAHQYGLIAQDVEPILPDLVSEATFPAQYDSLGNQTSASFTYKTLNYNAFIAILIRGMQEQNAKIDSLENQMNSCCEMNARTANNNTNQTDVTLTNSESVVLDQNVPNPFAEQTTITYNLPSTTKKAQMMFYDVQGKLIKVVDLAGTGKGQLNVFADDLSNGVYSYALVVDGQVSDTKRMVKTN
ncbi:MAG TPA: tail fiber domain-containing protein [Bacteroidia bacterium]|nr:tail fiber domain-containing protein [Bacteroidia bacterium]